MQRSTNGRHSPRFNPFNDDRSFSFNDDRDTLETSTPSEITSTGSEGSEDISLAELGLTEDYFSHPEGHFGLTSAEELEAAIDNCKSMILTEKDNPERKKKLVNKLIQLRKKFLELKDGPSEIEPDIKLVFGHKLRKRKSNSIKHYCECCNGLIWGMLQEWYRCKDCGFNCHLKCLNSIRRKCVAIDSYILEISPLTGLSAQQFNCVECKNPISVNGTGREEARLCDYTGHYFCPQCHWNDLCILPARVLHNWDFTPEKVSRQSYQLLKRLYRKPILNVHELNPLLFNYVDELRDIRKLREDILLMKAYFVTCNNAIEQKQLLRLSDRQHFVDNAVVYSLEDLVEIQEGVLLEDITKLVADYAKHIKLDCVQCQVKGFYCEICNFGETLFAFDSGASMCMKCKAVFHKDCFTCLDCPRCERMEKKKIRKQARDEFSDEVDDDETNDSSYLKDLTAESYDSDSTTQPEDHSPAFTTDQTPTNRVLDLPEVAQEASKPIDVVSKPIESPLEDAESPPRKDLDSLTYSGFERGRFSLPVVGRRSYMPLTPEKESSNHGNQAVYNNHTTRWQDNNHSNAENKAATKEITGEDRFKFRHHKPTKQHFLKTDVYSDKYESNPITRRAQRDESQYSDLVKVRGRSRSGKTKKTPDKEHSKKISVEDPFGNLKKTKGSQFMEDAVKVTSRSNGRGTETNPFERRKNTTDLKSKAARNNYGAEFDPNLDPFDTSRQKGQRFIDKLAHEAAPPRTGLAKYNSYDPETVPFVQKKEEKTPVGPRFFNQNPRFSDEAVKSVSGGKEKSPKRQPTRTNPTKVTPRSLKNRTTFDRRDLNPFESEILGINYPDDKDRYDEEKNPFS